MYRPIFLGFFVVLLAGSTPTARADEAPPPDYKDACVAAGIPTNEPGCTTCVTPEFKARECHERAAKNGDKEVCRGWSYVIYCPQSWTPKAAPAPATTPAAPPTSTPAKKACAGGAEDGLGLAAALALAARVRRWLRSRH